MRITTLSDGTKLQTARPYWLDGEGYRIPLMVFTRDRGCERHVYEYDHGRPGKEEEVWTKIHNAFVVAVCDLKGIEMPIPSVQPGSPWHRRRFVKV